MGSMPGGEPLLPFKLEVPSSSSLGLKQPTPVPTALERPSPSRWGSVISALETSTSEDERVRSSGGGTLEYEEPGREKPRNKVPWPIESRIDELGYQEPCKRPSE